MGHLADPREDSDACRAVGWMLATIRVHECALLLTRCGLRHENLARHVRGRPVHREWLVRFPNRFTVRARWGETTGVGQFETLRQTEPITYHNEFHLEVPVGRITRGGLSGSPVLRDDGKVVGMHCQGSENMVIAVKVEHLRRFLDGDLPWTACRAHSSVAVCIERTTRQTRELADSGDRVAQYQLGRDDGYLDKDVAMLRRAAEGGFAPAQASLGQWLRERKQWTEAARWFGRCAEQGDPACRVAIALRLYRAQGVLRDREPAFELMLEAARIGDMTAQHNVSVMYQRGNGTRAT